ncbi:MAG: permease-like cell division protein FtsX [Muribaculaceae bacterium]|nr:permease-like cell division protein FtsX [Muribaculaceae bacterium]
MTKKKSTRLSAFGSRITTVISVTLVLLILGIIAMAGLLARSGAEQIRSNMGFIVKVQRDAAPDEINRLKQQLPAMPYTASAVYASPEQILQEESQYLGEAAAEMLDINPYNPEFDIKVKSEYASADSIEAIRRCLGTDPAIEEIITAPLTISNVNFFVSRITWILLGIAGALLLISFVLINNTVYLAVYSRRFIIHTMKLVGATPGFIRRPFLLAGVASGLVAGAVAAGILSASQFWLASLDPLFAQSLHWPDMVIICAGIILAGVLICTLASALATNRYLRSGYDEMFMK